jgi:hypothetical protein
MCLPAGNSIYRYHGSRATGILFWQLRNALTLAASMLTSTKTYKGI